ncbi:hypothetical protein KFZ70_08110 [Tamlana fucoidanivorans]|nr:hypothetical protein [Tamlana fucoidanivorans]
MKTLKTGEREKAFGYEDMDWCMRYGNGHAKWVRQNYETKTINLSY